MKQSLFILSILGILFSCQPKQETSVESELEAETEAPSIVGAWEMTSTSDTTGAETTPYRSIIIYADGFYSVEIAWENIESWADLSDGEERSFEDISASYSRLTSNSGRYMIQGDSIIHEAMVAKHPNFMNDFPRWAVAYSLEGDQMMEIRSSRWGGISTKYRRLK